MTKEEKIIIQKAVKDADGQLSPAKMKGIANGDRRIVDNLVVRGYLEEVAQDKIGPLGNTYTINFYRVTEKGLVTLKSIRHRAWFNFKNNVPLYVGVFSIIMGILSISISSFVSWHTVRNATEANKISKQMAEVEYDNAQPFLIITGGDKEGMDVKIKNVGGGPAKNIYFLKQYFNASSSRILVLSKESDVRLGLAAGGEGEVSLNEQFMDRFEDKDKVLAILPCVPEDLLTSKMNWVVVFYENIRGERFVTKFNGLAGEYEQAVDFIKLTDCQRQ